MAARAAIAHAAFEKQYKPLADQNDKIAGALERREFEPIGVCNRRVRMEQFMDAPCGEMMTKS